MYSVPLGTSLPAVHLVEVESGLNSVSQTLDFQAGPAPSAAQGPGLPPSLCPSLFPAV